MTMKSAGNYNPIAKLFLLGMLSLGAGAANADGLSPPNMPLSNLSLHLSKDLSLGTSYAQRAFDAGPIQGHDGTGSISKVAKAYLNYTFLSQRTGSFAQNLQGQFEIANQSAFLLGPEARFRVDNTGLAEHGGRYSHDAFGHWADSGFLASLEWRLDAPGFADRPAFDNLTWGEVLQISFFADYGKTFSDSRPPNFAFGDSITPSGLLERGFSGPGIGTGLSFSLPGRLTANLRAAYPLHSWEPDGTAAGGAADPDSGRPRYWFDFSYNF